MALSDDESEEMYRMVKAIYAVLGRVLHWSGRHVDPNDPLINAYVPSWRGSDQRGLKFSQVTEPEFLTLYASLLDHFAEKKRELGDRLRAERDERTAKIARKWAAKLKGERANGHARDA